MNAAREALLLELARCFARAAVNAYVAGQKRKTENPAASTKSRKDA